MMRTNAATRRETRTSRSTRRTLRHRQFERARRLFRYSPLRFRGKRAGEVMFCPDYAHYLDGNVLAVPVHDFVAYPLYDSGLANAERHECNLALQVFELVIYGST